MLGHDGRASWLLGIILTGLIALETWQVGQIMLLSERIARIEALLHALLGTR